MVFPLSSDFTSWCIEMTPNISTKPQEYQQNPYEIMGMHTILGRYACITLCDPCWRWFKLLLWLYCGNLGYRTVKQYWQKFTVIEGNNKLLLYRKFRNSKKTTCSRPKAIEGEEMKVGKGRPQEQGCELLQRGGCPKNKWSWKYCEINLIFTKRETGSDFSYLKRLQALKELRSRNQCKEIKSLALEWRQVSSLWSLKLVHVIGV